MERGPVSINLVARIKAHPFYDERPEVKNGKNRLKESNPFRSHVAETAQLPTGLQVKELLESIIGAQPADVQKQTSKMIQQQTKASSQCAANETKLPSHL